MTDLPVEKPPLSDHMAMTSADAGPGCAVPGHTSAIPRDSENRSPPTLRRPISQGYALRPTAIGQALTPGPAQSQAWLIRRHQAVGGIHADSDSLYESDWSSVYRRLEPGLTVGPVDDKGESDADDS